MSKKNILLILILSLAGFADIVVTDVIVSEDMLHVNQGTVFGKVSYKLDADTCDSAFISLEITPKNGGEPIKFKMLEGAVGVIHILPAPTERAIWFSSNGPINPDSEYVAKVTADVYETEVLRQAKEAVAAASLNDMVTMFSGDNDFFQTKLLPGYPDIINQDGPHGVSMDLGTATCFTTCGGLACTWDEELAYEQGLAIGAEFRGAGRNEQLGPAMNIVWHPQLGRAFEYFSEDSYLSGRIAAAEVKGVQERGTLACIKHFVCNNMENDRANLSAQVDERSIRELFMPQFKRCVIEGGNLALMSAYNAVNGVFCTGHKYLITDVLRGEWGYRGYSMSDYSARLTNVDDGIQYGVDVLVPFRGGYTLSAFQANDISYARMHALNIMYANGKVGLFEPGYTHTAYTELFKSQTHRDLVRRIGARALILAKNNGNVLPIPKEAKKICLTGPEIDACRLGGGDTFDWESSLVDAFMRITPLAGITEVVNSFGTGGTEIVTDQWEADYIIVAIGVHGEGEGKDRTNPLVEDETAVEAALNVTTAQTIVLYTGGSPALPGRWCDAPAILICFGPGQEQGYSIADVLFGDVNPGGKLNITFPRTAQQSVNFTTVSQVLQYPRADSAHGYFRVNTMGEEPLFAFGHGLSYTTFSYSNLSIFPTAIVRGDRIYVSVDVTNTGAVAGDEVVQLYLSLPQGGAVPVRKQDLRGFKRITLEPQETETVSMVLEPEDMSYFKVGSTEFDGTGMWDILSGTYGVRVGTSSKITPEPDQPSLSGSFTIAQ